MAKYDVYSVFEKVPELLGMELSKCGDKWQGGYYLNGDRHAFRRDKLKVHKWKGEIWITEEGGESCSLPNWLQRFGGASDYWDAVRMIRGIKAPIVFEGSLRKKQLEVKYVEKDVLIGAKAWELERCPLFVWMCSLFGEEKVREAWRMYNVTTDSRGQAVFWFIGADGKIMHDKRMAYGPDGHRDKSQGAFRKFTMSKGYTGKCFFGANLWADSEKVYVVESEKTALLFWLYYQKPVVATGGKNGLREVDNRMILVPDMDAKEEWGELGEIWKWWPKFEGVEDHWDIGDAIVNRILCSK